MLPLCTAHGLKLSLDSAPVMSSSQRFDPAALASSSPIGSSSNQQNQSIPLNSSSGALSNSNSRNQNNSPANSASRSITNSTEMIPGSASNSSMLVRKHAAAEVEGTMLRRVGKKNTKQEGKKGSREEKQKRKEEKKRCIREA